MYQGTTLIRTLPMTAAGTSYTAVWDGRDASGALAPVAELQRWRSGTSGVRRATTRRRTVQVSAGVTSVTASPNPFVPTGSNSTTITVQATPGQTGLTLRLYTRVSNTYRVLVRSRLQCRTRR